MLAGGEPSSSRGSGFRRTSFFASGGLAVEVVRELVVERGPKDASLLGAEILLTTPSSFVLPREWRGTPASPKRQASLEYIEVLPQFLAEYRHVMRTLMGLAAARLVLANAIGTFRSMETAVVLYRDPAVTLDWNQIHLCEVKTDGFEGFGQKLDAEMKDIAPDGGFADVFARLNSMRTVRRWTFDDPLVEADAALCRVTNDRRQGLADSEKVADLPPSQ